jgi:hypothetical protein
MSQKKLFIFAPFGTFGVHHQIDAVVSIAMRLRQFEVFVVLCDGIYPICDVLAWSGERANIDCANCAHQSAQFFSHFKVNALQMRSYLTPDDFAEIDNWADQQDAKNYHKAQWQGIPIGEWIISSVCSYFRITSHQLHEPRVIAAHKKFLKNGLMTYLATTRILEAQLPTNAIIFNARFAPYRVAFEVCKKKNISVVVHERGWAQDTFITYANKIAIETSPIYECAEAWKDVPLQQSEIERVKNYFINREQGVDINVTPFITFSTEHKIIRAQLRIPPEIPILALFTTGEYELEFCEDYKAEISQIDFIKLLIDIFKDRKEALVIRHHPYIAGDSVSPPDRNFLSKAYELAQEIPDNVRMVMPGEKLSSYALFWNAAACIAPFSMTGVEAVARGIASFGFAQSPFKNGLSGVFPDFSRATVIQVIDRLFDSERRYGVEDLRSLYRFQSSFISRLCVKFQSIGIKDIYLPDVKINDLQQLAPGHDPVLDRLCDHIENASTLYEVPDSTRISSNNQEETTLIEEELFLIRKKREQVTEAAKEYFDCYNTAAVNIVYMNSNTKQSQWLNSIRKGRHQNIALTQVAGMDPGLVLEAVKSIKDAYCIIKGPEVIWYDEAFISRGIEELTADHDRQWQGIILGGWFVDTEGMISHGVFTRHFPGSSSTSIDEAFHSQKTWHHLLASVILRSEIAQILLSQLQSNFDDQSRYFCAREFLSQPEIKRMPEGLILSSLE